MFDINIICSAANECSKEEALLFLADCKNHKDSVDTTTDTIYSRLIAKCGETLATQRSKYLILQDEKLYCAVCALNNYERKRKSPLNSSGYEMKNYKRTHLMVLNHEKSAIHISASRYFFGEAEPDFVSTPASFPNLPTDPKMILINENLFDIVGEDIGPEQDKFSREEIEKYRELVTKIIYVVLFMISYSMYMRFLYIIIIYCRGIYMAHTSIGVRMSPSACVCCPQQHSHIHKQ